jgi:hypothetical protein
MKQERDGFRFKSFMIEMILAKLCDDGVDFSDYPEALQSFFTYVAKSNLREAHRLRGPLQGVERRQARRPGPDHRPDQCEQQRGAAVHRRERR